MVYRYMGRTGLRVSVLSFGAWVTWGNQVSDDVAYDCLLTAWKQGCNFFDNAEVYSGGKAEEVMGRCLKRLMKEESVSRSDFVVSTKIYWGGAGKCPVNRVGLSRKHIIEGIKGSLARLDLDHVDVLFAHRPDPETPMEETVRAFNYVLDKGWAFYWGTSEWSADQIFEAHGIAEKLRLIGPIVEQPQYSLLHRKRFEVEYSRLYKEIGLGTTIWSPLASGLLTGKYSSKDAFPEGSRLALDSYKWLKDQFVSGEGLNGLEIKSVDDVLTKVKALHPIAEKIGCTLPQLALAWCISNPNVSTVLTGASRSSQIVENFAALEFVPKITPAIKEEIDKILDNKPTPVKNYKG